MIKVKTSSNSAELYINSLVRNDSGLIVDFTVSIYPNQTREDIDSSYEELIRSFTDYQFIKV